MDQKLKISEVLKKYTMIIALAVIVILFTVNTGGKMLLPQNVNNLIAQNAYVFILATGMLFCILTGGNIDLSVGSNCVLCTCTIGVMVQSGITNPFLLVLCGLAVSTLAGFINGTLLTRLDLPHPFVSTMGMKKRLSSPVMGFSIWMTSAS